MKLNKCVIMLGLLLCIFLIAAVKASGEIIGTDEPSVCCQKTKSGQFCQDVKEADCASELKIPTSCDSTAMCRTGFCFDSVEGTCLDNVPQSVCNSDGGTWTETKPAQCELGCCVIGDQPLFVTLTSCKRQSNFYGVQTNYNPEIKDQNECLLTAGQKEKGACVFEKDFEKTCKLTTKDECDSENVLGQGIVTETTNEVQFFAGKLCSAEELGTNCAITKKTTCVPGKDEVYFVDSCGNPANIYDAKKVNDKAYWANILDKKDSCSPNLGNENSQSCGNCNYLLGSYCRESGSDTANPTYGDFVCQSLNCVDDSGEKKLHGESWCAYDSAFDFSPRQEIGSTWVDQTIKDAVANYQSKQTVSPAFLKTGGGPVGSRFYRQLCNNGEIVSEPCADFRQEECIEDKVQTSLGTFSQAACRVNRWQDCTTVKERSDCENGDKRDCTWLPGVEYTLMGSVANGTSLDTNSLVELRKQVVETASQGGIPRGACVAKIPPGLNFWQDGDAKTVCAQANAVCPVTYEKGISGGWKCVKNCECLDAELELKRAQLCMSMGDCGPKVNFVGSQGYTKGYKITQAKIGDSKK
ncbi:MAG: hypothetical protein AABY05_02065 [Nanoarchaeota archaeon]